MRAEGEVLLLYYDDQPTVYARLERVEPDVRKGWHHATLLLLTLPPQEVTWILREEYVDGATFTMGGKAMRLEAVPRVPVRRPQAEGAGPGDGKSDGGRGTVIPLRPRR